ncbi:hypothetical protein F6X40_23915 [Paraburkholderia sp. UCT31]|uniref:YpsA SLOG family protein n=1 Tax=Paraburkholderia sp. UCT31 TaxID=2615209 RepID=UPI001655F4F7|nr:putative molybdenum carrier protein [Paraburkholderia sp. UCT31]MBC8739763.1 hypothetical protein [Paraburkholderia sp. UCT31]
MQAGLFEEFTEKREAVTLEAHASSEYKPRTLANANGADVTVAFAVDFETAGERLTRKAAGDRYVAISYGMNVDDAARKLSDYMWRKNALTLNVAGNGIATLAKKGITQHMANRWVYDVLRHAHATRTIGSIRSGGQTGIDVAGLAAGMALGIPVAGLFPAGFRQRNEHHVDFTRTRDEVLEELQDYAELLR